MHQDDYHKNKIASLLESGSFEAAFSAYGLERQNKKEIVLEPEEILCCVAVRNEILRLPYFLEYYRQQGVSKFFIVDNDSTDETSAYLTAQPDVYTWRSLYPFGKANFGSAWFEVLLQRYGIGHWVLIVDADELFYFPECEQKTLPQLCRELEQENIMAYFAILLDMYSDTSIQETFYQSGDRFLDTCAYFDRHFYHTEAPWGKTKEQIGYWGGVRRRIFGGSPWDYCLNKVPLIRYEKDCILSGGQHGTNYSRDRISTARGCILHFKFFESFPNYARSEAIRQEHADQAQEYSLYTKKLSSQSNLTLYDPKHSLRFKNSQQLLELGIMQTKTSSKQHLATSQHLLLKTKQVTVYVKMAEAWLVKNKLEKGLAYYCKIIELDPLFVPAYLRLAYVLEESDRFEEALEYIEQAIDLVPNDVSLQAMANNLKTKIVANKGAKPQP